MKFKEIKIKKIELLEETGKTVDIKIKDVHHYILKNGIISHNSQDLFPVEKMSGGEGINYSASTIVYLSNAKLKTGEEDEMDLNSSGVIVTAKSRKNRLAKPKKIKFEINHSKGTNPYKGLEFFCTPDNFDAVGIAKVKPEINKKTGEITYNPGSKWYVKHLDKSLFESQLFNSQVFTKSILAALEPIIVNYFSYSSFEEQQEMLLKVFF